MNDMVEKVFFTPGQMVKLKQDLPNAPIMIVYKIERSIMRNTNGRDFLRGCKCRWFTSDGRL